MYNPTLAEFTELCELYNELMPGRAAVSIGEWFDIITRR